MKKYILAVLLVLIPASLQAAVLPDAPKVAIDFNSYHTYEELTDIYKKLAQAYPELATIESVGKSYQGRDIWVMIINRSETGPVLSKPAFYMDGNIHGNEIQASEACLYTLWYLLTNYGKVERVTKIVDRAAFYFIPSVNVDGRSYFLEQPNNPSSSRSGQRPVDDDRDGLFDEDGYDDLDGDGSITMMRKKDSAGRMKPDPEDPRLMVMAKPGEPGGWELLGMEGIDNDEDGRINEDPPGGYDLNRNWGYNWMPEYVQNGAGDYPMSHPESRAISEFLLRHPNIVAGTTGHNNGGMMLRGPGAKNMGQFMPMDVRVYDYLGERSEQLLPGYKYLIAYKDLYTTYGDFDSYLHGTFGAFAFTIEHFPDEWEDVTGDRKVDEKERLKFDDYLRIGEGFKEWKPFKHPTYGEIEIGGWTKMTQRPTPEFLLSQECHRTAAFVIFSAESMPLLKFGDVEVENVGGGLFRITAAVVNEQVIPTRSAQAVRSNIGRPDFAVISGSNLTVVSGGEVSDKYRGIVEPQYKDPAKLRVRALNGQSEVILQWLVKGNGSAMLTYNSLKGGLLEKTLELR